MENQTPSYVYVACARGEKRTHAQSTAEHVRYSVENMLHPVFLATEKNISMRRRCKARIFSF